MATKTKTTILTPAMAEAIASTTPVKTKTPKPTKVKAPKPDTLAVEAPTSKTFLFKNVKTVEYKTYEEVHVEAETAEQAKEMLNGLLNDPINNWRNATPAINDNLEVWETGEVSEYNWTPAPHPDDVEDLVGV